uniref:Replication factor C subunit 1 (inferred by orthology to a human protein) n=1 Tax=Strongyloides venezuelensis TaxID=75913 RepID=A0A0K0F6Z1_STRVS
MSSEFKDKSKKRKKISIESDDDDILESPIIQKSKKKIPKITKVESEDGEIDDGDLDAIRKSFKNSKEKKSPKSKKQKNNDVGQTKLEFFINKDKSVEKKEKNKQNSELKSISVKDYFSRSTDITNISTLNDSIEIIDDGVLGASQKEVENIEDKKKPSQVKDSPRKRSSKNELSGEYIPAVKKVTRESKLSDANVTKSDETNKLKTQKNKISPKKTIKNEITKSPKSISDKKMPKDKLWVDKYTPKTLKELVNQQTDKSQANKLLNWLNEWYKNNLGENKNVKKVKPTGMAAKSDGVAFKAALLSGPPGVGKTTCATLVCKELGLNYVQLNASDSRGKKVLQEKIEEYLQTKTINSFFKSLKSKDKSSNKLEQVLIMDEVDGMSGSDDRAGISELILMIKNTKIPIICICNDRFNRKISSLANHCFDLRFAKPTVNQVRARLMTIASNEGMKIPLEKMSNVVEASNLDIRQSIYNLQLMKFSGDTKDLSSKDTDVNIFDAARQILDPRTSLLDRRRLYFTDYSIMPLFIQQNYVNIEPVKLNKKETLKALSKSASVLSDVDVFERQIRTNQDWPLLSDQCTFAGYLVPSYMQGYLSDQLSFPTHLGKVSTTNKRYRMARQLAFHMSTKLTVDTTTLVTEILPLLRKQLAEPLINKGVDGIPEVIELYNQYSLTKEDHEFIVELTDWSNSEEIEKSIPSKVKAAFTRALNKEDRKLPFADLENDVIKVGRNKKNSKREVIKDEDSQDGSSEDESQIVPEFDY